MVRQGQPSHPAGAAGSVASRPVTASPRTPTACGRQKLPAVRRSPGAGPGSPPLAPAPAGRGG